MTSRSNPPLPSGLPQEAQGQPVLHFFRSTEGCVSSEIALHKLARIGGHVVEYHAAFLSKQLGEEFLGGKVWHWEYLGKGVIAATNFKFSMVEQSGPSGSDSPESKWR